MWRVLTTPNLVCLPKHPEKLLRTSFCCQSTRKNYSEPPFAAKKTPESARVSLRNPPGECSPWATSIRNRSRGPQGPRLIFGQADLEQRRAGPRGREGTPRRKRDAGHLRPAPPRVFFLARLLRYPYPSIPSASTQRASSARMAMCWGQACSQVPQPMHSLARLWPWLATSQPS